MTKEEAIDHYSEEIRDVGMVPRVLNDCSEEDGDFILYFELGYRCPIHGQTRGYFVIDQNEDGSWGDHEYEVVDIVGSNAEITYAQMGGGTGIRPCCEAFIPEPIGFSEDS